MFKKDLLTANHKNIFECWHLIDAWYDKNNVWPEQLKT